MEDLLNEEEFIKPEKYNPWKWFITYYLITIGCLILHFIITEYTFTKNFSVIIFTLFLILSPYILVFTKKYNIHKAKYFTIFQAIIFFYAFSWFLIVSINGLRDFFLYKDANYIFNPFTYETIGASLIFIIYSIFSFIIIYFILRYKRKKTSNKL